MEKKPTWNQKLAENWGLYPPPIRPSLGCINIFRLIIQLKQFELANKPKILLLGSTPELRDLCNSMNLSLTIVDFSYENNHTLSRLMNTSTDNETFLQQDWREMEFDTKFDLILAEASINVIPKNDLPKMITQIHKYLNPGGLFISKTWTVPNRFLSLEETIQEFRSHYSQYDFYSFSCGFLWLHFYNWEKETLSLRNMNIEIEKLFHQGVLNFTELNSIKKLDYPDVDLNLYLPRHEDMIALTEKHFSLEYVLLSSYINSYLYPILVFKAL